MPTLGASDVLPKLTRRFRLMDLPPLLFDPK
jgi:hypothetical protein